MWIGIRGSKLTVKPVVALLRGLPAKRVPESHLFLSARLCPRYQRGVGTRMRDEKALFMVGGPFLLPSLAT